MNDICSLTNIDLRKIYNLDNYTIDFLYLKFQQLTKFFNQLLKIIVIDKNLKESLEEDKINNILLCLLWKNFSFKEYLKLNQTDYKKLFNFFFEYILYAQYVNILINTIKIENFISNNWFIENKIVVLNISFMVKEINSLIYPENYKFDYISSPERFKKENLNNKKFPIKKQTKSAIF